MVCGVWQHQSEQSVLHVDNESYYVNSAVHQRGAWWYVECGNTNLNSVYYMLTMTAIMSTVLYTKEEPGGMWSVATPI